jgi:hypothetical protein
LVPVATFAFINTAREDDEAAVRLVIATMARISEKIFSFLGILNFSPVLVCKRPDGLRVTIRF